MGTILGIDYGTKNIGLAIGNSFAISPLMTLSYKKNHTLETVAIETIVNVCDAENVTDVVVGWSPGYSSLLNDDVREFTSILEGKLPEVKFHFVDEKHTSQEAVHSELQLGISKKKRSNDHAFSAEELLRRFLSGN